MLNTIIRFFLENKLAALILLILFVGWGIATAPFDWPTGKLPKDPVPVDAIPDIGENQQIVFTTWPGRSPQDIEDQITYPLTAALLGIPGVKTVRSSSVFGFSSIYIIFNEDIEFYWSRSRILEKLNSLPSGILPTGVQPALGPDATALGQIFWYTLEGRDPEGNPTGGWDLQELRTIQDYYVKYSLSSSEGVSEVASMSGFVKEYQIDLDPNALKAHNISIDQVMLAVINSNRDVGAKTIEINRAEYLVRGLGYVKKLSDLEEAVVSVSNNIPLKIIGRVSFGPATRRGLLDKSGAEAVGGVVVARYGSNPLEVINNVKEKIHELSVGLPSKTLADGTISKVTIIPFYDRSKLIKETIGTLEEALSLEILITVIVVVIMVMNLRASLLISSLLPIAVLMSFIAMKYFGVDANIVALSGIAIAIGTMVDIGIVLSENMLRHLDAKKEGESSLEVIYRATTEISGAVLTAVMTTIISFIPVFTMEAAEGKLFRPLAFTKSFALFSSLVVALIIIPPLAHWLFDLKIQKKIIKTILNILLMLGGIYVSIIGVLWIGTTAIFFAIISLIQLNQQKLKIPVIQDSIYLFTKIILVALAVTLALSKSWLPLGAEASLFTNYAFVTLIIGVLLASFYLVIHYYTSILDWCLRNKIAFLAIPSFFLVLGITIWIGFQGVFGPIATGMEKIGLDIKNSNFWVKGTTAFPGIGEEFMPALDEGSFLLMPTSMPHAGIEENKRVLQLLDMAVTAIPEIEMVVGKMGRVESALDPAPISMYEIVINYKSEYKTNAQGRRLRFKVDEEGRYMVRNLIGEVKAIKKIDQQFIDPSTLIPDQNGSYFRQWRDHIKSPDDIWNEIIKVTNIPGVTSAPKLQPIETRLIMLQTGMRAPMGIKVKGPDLHTIEQFAMQLENILKEVPSVKSEAVFADRIVGKPYIHININRIAIARYGLSVNDVQRYIETAIGGINLTSTVEGRERYQIRIRYPRELRNDPGTIENILIPTKTGSQIPLGQLVDIEYVRGPQLIKSEDTFLIGYVLFDKRDGYAEVEVVEAAQEQINEKIATGSLIVPAGISFDFAGNYENQVRASERLAIVVPLVLIIILLILYFQFKSIPTSLMVFSGIAVAFAGGFIMIWLYGQQWFFDFDFMGRNMRDLFQMKTINLSVAVWVGFIALFGIATDNGVILATYLKQMFSKNKPDSIEEIRKTVLMAGKMRIRPTLMTTATTILALLPVLTSVGRGADIMIPMAIPSFGGMLMQIITLFIVPVLYAAWQENKIKKVSVINEQ